MNHIVEIHDALTDIARSALSPPAAENHLAGIRARHPDIRVTLLWDVEPYDGSIHYDIIARDPSGFTTSMSVVLAGDALPWPVRGATRIGDRVLVEVDGSRLEIGDAVRLLDTLDTGRVAGTTRDASVGIAERIVQLCLIRGEVQRRAAAMTEPDRAAAVPPYLVALGLTGDDAAELWCRVRGLAVEDLHATAAEHAALLRLKRDGVKGRPYGTWLAERVSTADVHWFWSVGAGAGGT